jgi:epoxyqueuosine reductase
MEKQQLTDLIKKKALEFGFSACGIAAATVLDEHRKPLNNWLEEGCHGEMHYMANHFEKRLDPRLLSEGARSVIVVLMNYYPEKSLPAHQPYLISRYAYGTDYHFVIKEKLRQLQDFIARESGESQYRIFTDSAPVLERAWASRAGLGWIGKNSMLITPRKGSYFFIGEIITSLELTNDKPYGGDYCGDCSRCIDACPTQAIRNDRSIDARRCISYLTIEKKGEIAEEFHQKYKQWIFGCDICQEVCPWNRFSDPHQEGQFMINEEVRNMTPKEWDNLDKETFNRLFRKSPLKRAKHEGVVRNINNLDKTNWKQGG